MMNYFIFNCFDEIVGNPKGYRTMRGAIREQNRAGSPAYRAIWAAVDKARADNPEHTFVCRIAQKGAD